MKYALIENNIVKIISYQSIEGWEEVADTVCAEMIKKEDGTFDISDTAKTQQQNLLQEKQDNETNKTSGKTKLKNLGLTDDEIKALMEK